MRAALLKALRNYHFGAGPLARRARYVQLAFDLATLAYFVATTFVPVAPWMVGVDFAIGIVLLLELASRLAVAHNRLRYLTQPMTVVDVIVVVSLLAPALTGSFVFLRVLRALRIMRSYHLVADMRGRSRFFARNEDVIFSALNLAVFIFVVTAVVYELQVGVNPQIANYIDALYFTITTLTTTGFGDITLVGSAGRMLAVVIMIVGVSLFLRLVQTIFRPSKVRFACPDCGLARHDPDAVHCKHCGRVLKIASEGA